ncbi:MAG TPA: UTP--glucose-1-phosphate uridylyltransferase [Candidatus Atribacteria bacterium]|nr:UTP--glucose-1-phosphate uridylyltransferase [Candidatus Atribacteria bacterium]HPT77527.1 UTP--glucose-1-phosphate uridylyltransferase [Candidatus Atribacteria bacterium]
MIKKAVIPAAGMGTRMLPLTKAQPKEMLPLGRKPCIQYIVEELASVGVEQILFITGHKKRAIEDHFDKDNELSRILSLSGQQELLEELKFEDASITYFYTRQSIPAGLGHAISCARDFVGDEPFIIALGDSIIFSRENRILLRRMLDVYEQHENSFVIGTRNVPLESVHRYGIIEPLGDSRDGITQIRDLVEKPAMQNAPSTLAVAARYIMPGRIFDALSRTSPGRGGEIQLTDGIRLLLKEGMTGYAVNLTDREKRYDIGNFQSYYEAFVDFALNDEKYGYQLKQYIIKSLNL